MLPQILQNFFALLLAINYFAFQVEVFEEEYERNHRQMSEAYAVDAPTLTWESFDKDNAPKAFTINVDPFSEISPYVPSLQAPEIPSCSPVHPVRDKSPPRSF